MIKRQFSPPTCGPKVLDSNFGLFFQLNYNQHFSAQAQEYEFGL